MIQLMLQTMLQAYPLYVGAFPIIMLGYIRRKKRGEQQHFAYFLFCGAVLLTIAATCYSKDFFRYFDFGNLKNVEEIHFDPIGFLNNILLESMAGSFHATVNWLGNMGLFAMISFFASCMLRDRRGKTHRYIVLGCMAFSLLIEMTQLCFGRLADGMDVILNTCGGWLGCCGYNIKEQLKCAST